MSYNCRKEKSINEKEIGNLVRYFDSNKEINALNTRTQFLREHLKNCKECSREYFFQAVELVLSEMK